MLRAEVISIDVAKAVAIFAGESLAKTIEAQLPVTGHQSPVSMSAFLISVLSSFTTI